MAIDFHGNKVSVGDWVVTVEEGHVFRIGEIRERADGGMHASHLLHGKGGGMIHCYSSGDVVRLKPYELSRDAASGDRVAFVEEQLEGPFSKLSGAKGRVAGVRPGFIAWIPDGCGRVVNSSGRQLAKIPNIEAPKEDEQNKQTEYDVPNPMFPGLYSMENSSGRLCCEVVWNRTSAKYIVTGRDENDKPFDFEHDQFWTGLGVHWKKESDWQSKRKPVNIGWDPL